jgi:hypothetical protein
MLCIIMVNIVMVNVVMVNVVMLNAEHRGAQAMSQTFFALMRLRTNKLERLGPENCFSLVSHSSVKPEPGSTKKFGDITFFTVLGFCLYGSL